MQMKKKLYFSLSVLIFICMACSNGANDAARRVSKAYQSGMINEGMSETELVQKYGKPTRKRRGPLSNGYTYEYGVSPHSVSITTYNGSVFSILDLCDYLQ